MPIRSLLLRLPGRSSLLFALGLALSSIHGNTDVSLVVASVSDTTITLAWPGTAANYALQQADDLTPAGGWTPNQTAPVLKNGQLQVELPKAGHARFYRLAASAAGTPTLDPIPEQSVAVGTTLTLTLHATDPNQLPLIFSVNPLPLPSGARFDGIHGVLTFHPTASQSGTNDLTFSVSNGAASVSQSARIVVPPVVVGGGTFLAGRILDTSSAVGGAEIPIVGAVVSLKGFNPSTTSQADGSFLLSGIPAGKQVVDFDVSGANSAPDGSGYAAFREEMTLLPDVTNVLSRPVYLPRLDASSLTTIDPTKTVQVVNTNLGVSLTVLPNTAKTMDGFDFTDQMSISLVPKALAPVSLPEDLQPGMLITIQPVGVQFTTPVPITFPNSDNLAPGTETDIWSVDPTLGVFTIVGKGRVTADGKSIKTISGGVRAADWHMTLPPRAQANTADNSNRREDTCDAGSLVDLYSGVLSTDFYLPAYFSKNAEHRLKFVYNSLRAFPEFLVPFNVDNPVGAPLLSYELNVAGFNPAPPTYIDPSTLPRGETSFRSVAKFDASSLATGLYPYQFRITSHYLVSAVSSRQVDDFPVVAGSESPFGVGWGIAGLQQLYPQADGRVLLADGSGTSLVFRNPTNSYDLPTGQWIKNADLPLQSFQFFSPVGAVTMTDGIHILLNNRSHFLYNPQNDSWLTLPTPGAIPQFASLTAAGAGTANGKLYVVETYSTNNYTWEYNPATKTWQNLFPIPFNGAVRAVTSVGDQIYVLFTRVTINVGGKSKIEPILLQFNPAQNSWIELGPTPVQFNDSELQAAAVGTRIYVVGDRFTFVPLPLRIYDTITHGWSDGPSLPKDLHLSGVTGLAGRLFVCGGTPTDANGAGTKTIQIFDPQTGAWSNGPDMPTARFSCVAAATDRALFVFGGINGTDLTTWHKSEEYILPNVDNSTVLYAENDPSPLVKLPDGSFQRISLDGISYNYSQGGRLTSITDRNANSTIFQYNGAQLLSITDPAGLKTTFSYSGKLLEHITDPAGRQTTFAHSGSGDLQSVTLPDGHARSYAYDAHHLLVTEVFPAGNTIQHKYDANGRLSTVILPDNVQRTFTPAQSVGLVDTSSGSGTQQTPASAVSTKSNPGSQLVNALGNVSSFTFDQFGQAATETDSFGRTVQTTTDTNGLPVQVTYPTGRTILVTYDDHFNPVKVKDSSVGSVTSYTHDAFGLATSVTDSFGNTSSITRDAHGNATQIKSAAGRITQTTYNSDGSPGSFTSPNGARTQFSYDAAGDINDVVTAAGTDTREVKVTHDSNGQVDSATDPENHTVHFTRDAVGRLLSSAQADGTVTEYGYDANGRRISIGLTGQQPHRFSYNVAGQITRYDPPASAGQSSSTIYTYNAEFQPLSIQRPDNKTVQLGYDTKGRLIALGYARGQTTYQYDQTTSLITSVQSADGVTLDFTSQQGLIMGVRWSGAVQGSVERSYDAVGRIKTTSINGGDVITLQRDTDGLVVQGGALVLDRRTSDGLPTGLTLGKIVEEFTYNGFSEVASQSVTAGGVQLWKITYTRDKLGRVTQAQEQNGSQTDTSVFSYSPRGSLVQVTKNGQPLRAYTYDAEDNRTSVQDTATTTLTYDVQDRLLSETSPSGTIKFGYTANGELAFKTNTSGVTTYLYDELSNLLKVVTSSGSTVEYIIDGQNHRVARKLNGSITHRWVYESRLRPAAEVDATGAVVTRYIYVTKSNVPDYITRQGATYRIITDEVGSVRFVVDTTSGNVVQALSYDEFGNVLQDTNPGFQPFGFAGGLYDPATGLVRFGARDYDATVGRWTCKDPAMFRGRQVNLYAYVGNDPINQVDPSGLDHLNPNQVYGPGLTQAQIEDLAQQWANPQTPQPPPPSTTDKALDALKGLYDKVKDYVSDKLADKGKEVDLGPVQISTTDPEHLFSTGGEASLERDGKDLVKVKATCSVGITKTGGPADPLIHVEGSLEGKVSPLSKLPLIGQYFQGSIQGAADVGQFNQNDFMNLQGTQATLNAANGN